LVAETPRWRRKSEAIIMAVNKQQMEEEEEIQLIEALRYTTLRTLVLLSSSQFSI
jgi:hypothetical protein